jgi:MOSC domain-containing protein YiiM
MTRRLNVDGDGQGDLAGHGGEHRAVFVYRIESYRYWQNQFGRNDFTYGQFGENFTVEDWRILKRALAIMTGSAMPCSK